MLRGYTLNEKRLREKGLGEIEQAVGLLTRLDGRPRLPDNAMVALALFVVYGSGLRFQGTTFNSEAIMTLPAVLGCLFVAIGLQLVPPATKSASERGRTRSLKK